MFLDDGGKYLGKFAETFLVDNFNDLKVLREEVTNLGIEFPPSRVVSFDQENFEKCDSLLPGSKEFHAVVANSILDILGEENRFEV